MGITNLKSRNSQVGYSSVTYPDRKVNDQISKLSSKLEYFNKCKIKHVFQNVNWPYQGKTARGMKRKFHLGRVIQSDSTPYF